MLHPLFSVVVGRPDLVAEHLAGYAALVREEGSSLGSHLVQRGVAWGVALLSVSMALVLAGVAVMLGAMQSHFHWALVAVPVIAVLPALWAWQVARQPLPGPLFEILATQFQADVRALRAAGDIADDR